VKDVVILGMQKMFEIWDAERWALFESDSGGSTALDDVRARLAEKGV
jgi:DNA-binding transcriptional regulator/RsmH inhibitor MraZ